MSFQNDQDRPRKKRNTKIFKGVAGESRFNRFLDALVQRLGCKHKADTNGGKPHDLKKKSISKGHHLSNVLESVRGTCSFGFWLLTGVVVSTKCSDDIDMDTLLFVAMVSSKIQ